MWEPPEYPGPCFDLHFDRFDGFIFEAEKPFENVCATGASPVCACYEKQNERYDGQKAIRQVRKNSFAENRDLAMQNCESVHVFSFRKECRCFTAECAKFSLQDFSTILTTNGACESESRKLKFESSGKLT